jgi:hypothetical protein
MIPNRLQRITKFILYSGIFGGVIYLIFNQGIKQFIINLPTIYHSLFFLFLGIWLWGINIHVLERTNIDCTSLLASESRPLRNPNSSYISYNNTYKLALNYTAIFFASVLVYNYCSLYYEKSTTDLIAIITLIASIYTLFMPNKFLYKKERKKFVDALIRIITPSLKFETAFCDVVMADLITSFSKVIGDMYVALAEIFLEIVIVPYADKKYGDESIISNGKSQKEKSIHIHHHILLDLFGAMMILLPYLFRLRQCIADYYTKATKSERTKSLLNAIKYGTSIPVYVLSGYYSWIKSDIKSTSEKELLDPMYKHAKIVFTLWVIASFINSGYSYYWDIFNDWGLCKRKKDDDEKFPFLLRPILHFSKYWTYYAVMIIDLILRFTWFVDLFPIFQLKNPFLVDDTPTIPEDIKKMRIEKLLLSRLLLRALEIIRRWLWIFFRLEKEWVYTSSEYRLLE